MPSQLPPNLKARLQKLNKTATIATTEELGTRVTLTTSLLIAMAFLGNPVHAATSLCKLRATIDPKDPHKSLIFYPSNPDCKILGNLDKAGKPQELFAQMIITPELNIKELQKGPKFLYNKGEGVVASADEQRGIIFGSNGYQASHHKDGNSVTIEFSNKDSATTTPGAAIALTHGNLLDKDSKKYAVIEGRSELYELSQAATESHAAKAGKKKAQYQYSDRGL